MKWGICLDGFGSHLSNEQRSMMCKYDKIYGSLHLRRSSSFTFVAYVQGCQLELRGQWNLGSFNWLECNWETGNQLTTSNAQFFDIFSPAENGLTLSQLHLHTPQCFTVSEESNNYKLFTIWTNKVWTGVNIWEESCSHILYNLLKYQVSEIFNNVRWRLKVNINT
jgi:hypothetical protein